MKRWVFWLIIYMLLNAACEPVGNPLTVNKLELSAINAIPTFPYIAQIQTSGSGSLRLQWHRYFVYSPSGVVVDTFLQIKTYNIAQDTFIYDTLVFHDDIPKDIGWYYLAAFNNETQELYGITDSVYFGTLPPIAEFTIEGCERDSTTHPFVTIWLHNAYIDTFPVWTQYLWAVQSPSDTDFRNFSSGSGTSYQFGNLLGWYSFRLIIANLAGTDTVIHKVAVI